MIGLVLLLLLPTPTIWFSLVGTLFSLDHNFYASDFTTPTPTPTPTPSLVKTSLKEEDTFFVREWLRPKS